MTSMRLGLISDVASGTGFGRVARELSKRWLEAGCDMRIIGINWRGMAKEMQVLVDGRADPDDVREGYRLLLEDEVLSRTVAASLGGDPMGNDLTAPFINGDMTRDWRPDKLVVIADPRAMLERIMSDQGSLQRTQAYNYCPIEGAGLTPFWRTMWEMVRPVAMSEFGARQVGDLMGRKVPVVRHGISDSFHRVSPEHPGMTSKGVEVTSREQAREILGWTDKTVILRTDRNVPRKDYPAFFAAITPIIDAHPEVLVIIHCSPIDEGGVLTEHIAALPGAWNPGTSALGWRHSQVQLTSAHDTFKGLTDNQLNILYNAADIYASPTMAEGFGLTLAEAAATGCAVVTTDFAAGPEAVGPGAVLVPPARIVGNIHAHTWSIVDVPAFTEALERLVCDPAERERLGRLGEQHVKRFDWDIAALEFLRVLDS